MGVTEGFKLGKAKFLAKKYKLYSQYGPKSNCIEVVSLKPIDPKDGSTFQLIVLGKIIGVIDAVLSDSTKG